MFTLRVLPDQEAVIREAVAASDKSISEWAREILVRAATRQLKDAKRRVAKAGREDSRLDAEGYEEKLEGLGDPALVRTMREGDWDISDPKRRVAKG